VTHLLLRCGVVGPILFIAVFLIEGAIRPGYRPWRHFVSLLAHGERGWVQATNFFVFGSLCLCFAAGLARLGTGVALPVLFALLGVGLIASGLFPCDAGLGYPPGAVPTWPQRGTPSGNPHNLAGVFVFGPVIISALVVGARSAGGFAIYSILSGVLMFVFFIAAGALAARASEVRDLPVGIAQRLAIIVGWIWIAVFAWHIS
jgi:hypothetical membrane protein